MRFEEINWLDVENYLQNDDRVIIILGACEQHGYLSLLCDANIPQALADAAARKTGVLIAPSVPFGISPYFLSYPGTISLRSSTYLELVEDLITSLHVAGFRRFLVLNGHGGNEPAKSRLVELENRLPGMKAAWYSWWTSNSVLEVAHRHDLAPTHANWLEAFPFTVVSDLPEGEKPFPVFKGLPNAEETRKIYGDGSFGGKYCVDDAIMEEVFSAALEDILFLLDF